MLCKMKISDLSLIGKKCEGFTLFSQIKDFDIQDTNPKDKVLDTKSSDDVLFDEIFSVNPFTGLPDGDLAIFMNENTSPSVKQFIELNLRKDTNLVSDSAGYSGQLSDDLIAEYMRNSDESIDSYRERLVSIVRDSVTSKANSDGV